MEYLLAFIALALVLAISCLAIYLTDRRRRQQLREAEKGEPAARNQRLNWPVAVLVSLVVIIITPIVLFAPSVDRILHDLLIVLSTLLVVFIGAVYCWYRWKQRAQIKAVRLAQAGQVAEAIAILETHMRENGPSVGTCNDLGAYFCLQNRWQDALLMFEQAESLGDQSPLHYGNKGLTLRNVGRLEEGLSCLEMAAQKAPEDITIACNLGTALAESGRLEDAAALLRRAEHLYPLQKQYVGAANRPVVEKMLTSLRDKIEAKSDSTN
jgi:tetratricopeptide (TPR) repeat protein